MRLFDWRTVLVAAIAGAGVTITTAGAQAHDDDWRWEKRHHREHWRHYDPPRRVVYERARPRVAYERPPVVVAPAPVYMAPAYSAPAYSGPSEPSMNLNFNIPLR